MFSDLIKENVWNLNNKQVRCSDLIKHKSGHDELGFPDKDFSVLCYAAQDFNS